MTLENRLNHKFKNVELLERALTHKSFFNENSEDSPGHNERLEFLGDAVLDLTVSHLLMETFPEAPEGELSKRRANMVNETTLAKLAQDFELAQDLRLGKGEVQTGGAEKPRLLASAFEAVIGAFYLDAGYAPVKEFVLTTFAQLVNGADSDHFQDDDFKTRLQEITQQKHRLAPEYELVGQEGPDHEKTFFVAVRVGDKELARGRGRSKKQAEQEAARVALEKV